MASLHTIKTLSTISSELREQGETIVLTHGIFDLYHPGYALLFRKSRRLGDFLMVGVESDERVASYTSSGKPIIPLDQRIEALLEHRSVDFVFVIDALPFDSSHYGEIYRDISPHFITFGKKTKSKPGILKDKEHFPDISFVEINAQFRRSA